MSVRYSYEMNSRGYGAILFVIVTATMMLQFLIVSNSYYLTQRMNILQYMYKIQSERSAQSCLNIALLYLAEDTGFRIQSGAPLNVSDGNIQCTISEIQEDADHSISIRTTGMYKDIQTSLKSILTVDTHNLHILSTKKVNSL